MVRSTCENTSIDVSKYLEILRKARSLTDSFLAFEGRDKSFACRLLSDGHLTGKALASALGVSRYAVVSGITPKGLDYLSKLQNPVRTPFERTSGFISGGFRRLKSALFA